MSIAAPEARAARLRRALADPRFALRRLGQMALQRLCGPMADRSFFLQGQMDIHPRGRWRNPAFVALTGGFFPPEGPGARRIEALDPFDIVRRDMLVLLMRALVVRGTPGALAEVGVYRGQTARLLHHYMPERRLYLFDTFEGFAAADLRDDPARTDGLRLDGHFADTSLARARRMVAPRNDNVIFRPGLFPDSADAETDAETYALVHLDADLKAPIAAGLAYFWPRLAPGGVIVAHDYNAWAGARAAVDEFCAERRLIATPMPDKSGSAVLWKPLAAHA